MARSSVLIFLLSACLAAAQTANRSTDPADFTTVSEITIRGSKFPLATTNAEVDNQSVIHVHFDAAKMGEPVSLVSGGPKRPVVRVRVEAYAVKGTSRSPIAPIPHYVELLASPAPVSQQAGPGNSEGGEQAGTPGQGSQGQGGQPAAESTSVGTVVYHDKYFNPEIHALVPDTDLRLAGTLAGAADFVDLTITNLMTQQSLTMTLVPKQFGFHAKVSDTLMFVKRLGISSRDRQNGISEFNFGPSPGVTYGGTYFARTNAFLRFLQPGVGITVLFTKWDNPSFDISTGQFAPGTKSSDIQMAMGGQLTLFANVVQLGYGANLQVEQKRQYFGIGLSFVNLTTKIAGLLGK